MRNAIISTSAGNTFAPPNALVALVTTEGIREEYVSSLKEGDVVYFKAEYVPTDLDEVISVLYQKVPGYAKARNFLFTGEFGRDIPRLRYDLIEAAARISPDLFSKFELEDLENKIVKTQGDFSTETINGIAEFIHEVTNGLGFNYNKKTV